MSNLNDIINQQREEIAQIREQLAKANEIISECWCLVGNDVDSKSALPESVNSLNERVKELEEENGLMMTRLMAAALGLASGKSCPTAIEELNKFAIEKKIEGMQRVLDCRELNLSQGEIDTIKLMQEQLSKGVNDE